MPLQSIMEPTKNTSKARKATRTLREPLKRAIRAQNLPDMTRFVQTTSNEENAVISNF
jgi:hypothetical protein